MADEEWLKVLRQGTEAWSDSRKRRNMEIDRKIDEERRYSWNSRLPRIVFNQMAMFKKREYIDLTSWRRRAGWPPCSGGVSG